MKRTDRLSLLAPLALAAGCAAMMPPIVESPTLENPLTSGQPLAASAPAKLFGVTEDGCTLWPFEDTLTVTVAEARICITSRKHMAEGLAPGEPYAMKSEMIGVSHEAARGGITVAKTRASKVASCIDSRDAKRFGVWVVDYEGCAPNNGMVTASTKSLTVGTETWRFAAATPPATASTAK